MTAIDYLQVETNLTRHVQRWNRRLRLVESLVWGPRALIIALVIGIGIAFVSRLSPWLLPEQVARITGAIAGVTLLAVLGLIWLWPRQTRRAARDFDRRFLLNERVSTALEISSKSLVAPEAISSLQLSDALAAADGVDARRHLPVKIKRWEIVALVALFLVLAALLLLENPQALELKARQELNQAIAQQSAALDSLIEEIENNDALTPAEKEALIQPLEEAQQILSRDDVTQQEAVAALASAQQSLEQLSGGMLSAEQQAYHEAAQELAGSDLTLGMAQGLNESDLGSAANAARDVAQELAEGDLSQPERDELANQFDAAADALEANNPALAAKLREAADALRQGDEAAAQQALQEAAETLEAQREQLEQSELAETSQSSQAQLSEGQESLAQAGREASQESQESQAEPEQLDGTQGLQQAGQQMSQQSPDSGQDPAQGDTQAGQEGETGAPGQQNQAQQQGQPEASEDDSVAVSPQGAGTSAEDSPAAGQESADGQSESDAGGEGQSSAESGSVAEGSGQDGSNAPASGLGEGGPGADVVEGMPSEAGQAEIPTGNAAANVDGDPEQYESDNVPTTIGGTSDVVLDVGGPSSEQDGAVVQEGDLGTNPTGQSSLSYTEVYGDYQDAVSDALESGRIPLDQRDVIHDYFSSLEP